MKKPENEQKKMNGPDNEEAVVSKNEANETASKSERAKDDASKEKLKDDSPYFEGVPTIDMDDILDGEESFDINEVDDMRMMTFNKKTFDKKMILEMSEKIKKRGQTLGDLMRKINTELKNLEKWREMLDCRSVFPDFYTEQLIKDGEALFCPLLAVNPITPKFSENFEQNGEYVNVLEAICDVYLASEQRKQFGDWRNRAHAWLKKQEERLASWEARSFMIMDEAIQLNNRKSETLIDEVRRWDVEAEKMKAQTDRLRNLIFKVDCFLKEYTDYCNRHINEVE